MKLTRGRLLALAAVLVFGAIWFYPRGEETFDQTQTTESTAPAAAATPIAEAVSEPSATPRSSAPDAEYSDVDEPDYGGIEGFQKQSRKTWDVRRAGARGTIKTLANGLWSYGQGDYELMAKVFVRDFVEGIFGVSPDSLVLNKLEKTDRTKAVYNQVENGVPVYGATLTLFFENGVMTRVQNDLVAKSPTLNSAIAGTAVFAAFQATESARYTQVANVPMQKVFYPGPTSLVRAYVFSARETATGKTYRIIFDAENRHVIKKMPSQLR